jgi:hypothetical protein
VHGIGKLKGAYLACARSRSCRACSKEVSNDGPGITCSRPIAIDTRIDEVGCKGALVPNPSSKLVRALTDKGSGQRTAVANAVAYLSSSYADKIRGQRTSLASSRAYPRRSNPAEINRR